MKVRTLLFQHLWQFFDSCAGCMDALATWARHEWVKTQENPMKGRAVRYIRTGGGMGDDCTVRHGVVIKMYRDTVRGMKGQQIMIVVQLEPTIAEPGGSTVSLPVQTFFANPDDGALEYRY
jgi:hypothetical protein